ncbi:MAG: hypothetical protein J6Q59_02480 [Paludibacteraceae bacterium]|nr:hypothetical protein [Paludibacteraceae bacterium]
MKKEVITRIKLTASEGMVLTDGETFGTDIYLEAGKTEEGFKEITQAEYKKILAEQAAEAEL